MFSKRFETLAIIVKDPFDKTLPRIKGELVIENPATKEQMVIDPSVVRKDYEKNVLEQEKILKKGFEENGIDYVELLTNEPIATSLAEFLKERVGKKRYIIPNR